MARKDGTHGRSYALGREHWVELGRRMRKVGRGISSLRIRVEARVAGGWWDV